MKTKDTFLWWWVRKADTDQPRDRPSTQNWKIKKWEIFLVGKDAERIKFIVVPSVLDWLGSCCLLIAFKSALLGILLVLYR